MKLNGSTIHTVIIITIATLFGGVVAFFLPGQLGIMSPDKWYDDPPVITFIGLLIGAGIGLCVNALIKRKKTIVS